MEELDAAHGDVSGDLDLRDMRIIDCMRRFYSRIQELRPKSDLSQEASESEEGESEVGEGEEADGQANETVDVKLKCKKRSRRGTTDVDENELKRMSKISHQELGGQILEVIAQQQDEIAHLKARTELDIKQVEAVQLALEYVRSQDVNFDVDAVVDGGLLGKGLQLSTDNGGKKVPVLTAGIREVIKSVSDKVKVEALEKILLSTDGRKLVASAIAGGGVASDAHLQFIDRLENCEKLRKKAASLQEEIAKAKSPAERTKALQEELAAARDSQRFSGVAAVGRDGGLTPGQSRRNRAAGALTPLPHAEANDGSSAQRRLADWIGEQSEDTVRMLEYISSRVEEGVEELRTHIQKLAVNIKMVKERIVMQHRRKENGVVNFDDVGSQDVTLLRSQVREARERLEDAKTEAVSLASEEEELRDILQKLVAAKKTGDVTTANLVRQEAYHVMSRVGQKPVRMKPRSQFNGAKPAASIGVGVAPEANQAEVELGGGSQEEESSDELRAKILPLTKEVSALQARKAELESRATSVQKQRDEIDASNAWQALTAEIAGIDNSSTTGSAASARQVRRYENASANAESAESHEGFACGNGNDLGCGDGGGFASVGHSRPRGLAATVAGSPESYETSLYPRSVDGNAGGGTIVGHVAVGHGAQGNAGGCNAVGHGASKGNDGIGHGTVMASGHIGGDGNPCGREVFDCTTVHDAQTKSTSNVGTVQSSVAASRGGDVGHSSSGGAVAREQGESHGSPLQGQGGTKLGDGRRSRRKTKGLVMAPVSAASRASNDKPARQVSPSEAVNGRGNVSNGDRLEEKVLELLAFQKERERLQTNLDGIEDCIREARMATQRRREGGNIDSSKVSKMPDFAIPEENKTLRREVARRQRELNKLRKRWCLEKGKQGVSQESASSAQVMAAVRLLLADPPQLPRTSQSSQGSSDVASLVSFVQIPNSSSGVPSSAHELGSGTIGGQRHTFTANSGPAPVDRFEHVSKKLMFVENSDMQGAHGKPEVGQSPVRNLPEGSQAAETSRHARSVMWGVHLQSEQQGEQQRSPRKQQQQHHKQHQQQRHRRRLQQERSPVQQQQQEVGREGSLQVSATTVALAALKHHAAGNKDHATMEAICESKE
eukprot:TRINITY_DN21724_c0_g1_i1.p1 TRINITY_DN21724_c0_g1~~TRINITY_DN21724_c0_g1_i1.p1  ORF type:complete len:1316 (+),score=317.88 TRINITY_DN21724_c0_g1_i1:580-3948(+)